MTYYRNMANLTPMECIEKLREIETVLHKMLDRYRIESVESKNMAKRYINDDQRILAKACLRRCRLLDHQMISISQRISKCEEQRLAIEQMQSMNQQVAVLRDTTRTFNTFIKTHDIDRIESLQDTLKQAILDTCDINEVLSEELTPILDEDDLESELKSLMLSESINRSFPSTPEIGPHFPKLPGSPLPKTVTNATPQKIPAAAYVF